MAALKILDTEETRNVLPYRQSTAEYLKELEELEAGKKAFLSSEWHAWAAFRAGKNYIPATFEYGTNAGDYASPLVAQGNELWYHMVRQGERTQKALIAVWEVA